MEKFPVDKRVLESYNSPDLAERKLILEKLVSRCPNIKEKNDIDFDKLASLTDTFSALQLREMVKYALIATMAHVGLDDVNEKSPPPEDNGDIADRILDGSGETVTVTSDLRMEYLKDGIKHVYSQMSSPAVAVTKQPKAKSYKHDVNGDYHPDFGQQKKSSCCSCGVCMEACLNGCIAGCTYFVLSILCHCICAACT